MNFTFSTGHKKELAILKSQLNKELWNLLADNGCWIAGGACTSIFSNKEINDIDVYFPSKTAFAKVTAELFGLDYELILKNKRLTQTWEDRYDSNISLSSNWDAGIIKHVTQKSLMLQSGDTLVQLINHKFFDNPGEIFDSFDFTINMCAYDMPGHAFVYHEDFFKHLAQRYLKFNPNTSYPFNSSLRVQKYRDRGYTISKSEFTRILLAIAQKNMTSWGELIEELGGMYGEQPEEIFDMTKPFTLDEAMEQLDNIEKRPSKKYIFQGSTYDYASVVQQQPHAFPKEIVELLPKMEDEDTSSNLW